MKLSRNHLMFGLIAVLLILSAFTLAGNPILPPDALAGLGMLPLMSGEIDMKEIKTLLEKQGEAWGEFTRKNDELLKAKAEGKAVSELQATVDKVNGELSKLNSDVIEMAKKANRPANDGGDRGAARAEFKKAFNAYARTDDESGLVEIHKKAMISGSGPDGGYLVLPELDTEISRVVSVVSAIGRLADQRTIGTSMYRKIAKTTGMTARRVGAGATGGETTNPKFAELEFPVYDSEAEPWVHNETLEDAIIDLEMDLSNEAAIAFAELAGSEFASGDGVGKAFGITAYSSVANASYAWGSIGYIKSGANGAFAASNPGDKIIDLQHSLKPQYRPGAAWVMGDATLSQVRQMKDGSGNFYLWQPDPLAGFGGRLLGSPVETDDNMPVYSTTGNLAMAYGNFKEGYVVVNRSGIKLIRDNITAKGKTKFNFRRRFGGGVKNFEAIKLMKFSA